MSRHYRIDIKIEKIHTVKDEVARKLKKELERVWFRDGVVEVYDTWDGKTRVTLIEGCQGGYLGCGESEKEFAKRITHFVWEVAGKYLPVSVTATYLEELPYNTYTFNETEYNLFNQKEAKLGINDSL